MALRLRSGLAYSEWLRVRGCLKWTAIVLGVLFLVAVIVRIAIIGKHDYTAWALSLASDPGAKSTESTFPDGTHRIVIDDPAKQLRVVVDERGSVKHVQIYDKTGETSAELEHSAVTMGDVKEQKLPNGQGTLTTVDTNGETDFLSYIISGLCIALVVATILGAPFARENDGHLEVSLTKPISREMLGIQTVAVDVAGILVSFAGGIVFAIAAHMLFEIPGITFGSQDAMALGAGILAPLAWYAMLACATASLKRGWGAVIGFAWPVALVVVGLSLIEPNGNVLLTLVRDVAGVLSFIDPIRYMHFGTESAPMTIGGQVASSGGFKIGMLGLLALVYGALAIVQWRRIEA